MKTLKLNSSSPVQSVHWLPPSLLFPQGFPFPLLLWKQQKSLKFPNITLETKLREPHTTGHLNIRIHAKARSGHVTVPSVYFLTGSCYAASWFGLHPARLPETPPPRSVFSCPAPGRRECVDTWKQKNTYSWLLLSEWSSKGHCYREKTFSVLFIIDGLYCCCITLPKKLCWLYHSVVYL